MRGEGQYQQVDRLVGGHDFPDQLLRHLPVRRRI